MNSVGTAQNADGFFFAISFSSAFGLEARHQHHLGADRQRPVHHAGHGEGVEERQDRQRRFAAPGKSLNHNVTCCDVDVDIGVTERGALGDAGGAAGILQQRQGVVSGSMVGGVTMPSLSVRSSNGMKCTSSAVFANCLERAKGANRRLAKGSALGSEQTMMRLQRRALELRAQLGDQAFQPHGHHDGDAGIHDLVLDLAVGIERVEVHHHAAGLEDAEIGDHEVGAIGQEQADPVARLDALVDQPAREAVGQRLDVG